MLTTCVGRCSLIAAEPFHDLYTAATGRRPEALQSKVAELDANETKVLVEKVLLWAACLAWAIFVECSVSCLLV